jgi:hypothetical protein
MDNNENFDIKILDIHVFGPCCPFSNSFQMNDVPHVIPLYTFLLYVISSFFPFVVALN